MSNKRYTEEFKIEAVKQVTERGHAVVDVATRLDVSQHSLYQWVKRFSVPAAERKTVDDQHAEIRRLNAELKHVSEERDILKKGRYVLRQAVRVKYAFVQDHQSSYPVRRLCKMMEVHPSDYYAWLQRPESTRTIEDQRLLGHVKQSWLESESMAIARFGKTCANWAKHVAQTADIDLCAKSNCVRRPATIVGQAHAADLPRCMRRTICKGSLRRPSQIVCGSPNC